VRIGVLGAARIAPMALIRPSRDVADVRVTAVAAREQTRAESFARKHGVARAHASYDALLADPEIDAVYNPLPNSLHCEWTVRALEAGKHVLCEKPISANAVEAAHMNDAATRAGKVLGEAFHWRYHPLAARMRAILESGEIGAVRHVEVIFCIPFLLPGDIRYRLDLAGGATMDVGSYTVSIVRFLAGAEPEVTSAQARLSSPGVDRWMRADLRFSNGVTGCVVHALCSAHLIDARAIVSGEHGSMSVLNPIAPHFLNRIKVKANAGTRVERVTGEPTYTAQLRAFAAAVRGEASMPTDGPHGVANMRVIDAIYEKAGLGRRGA
jgi:predicted dehydrogenase